MFHEFFSLDLERALLLVRIRTAHYFLRVFSYFARTTWSTIYSTMGYDKYDPYSGTEGLEEEMKEVCRAVQADGFAERDNIVEYFRNIICGQNRNVNVECYGSSSTGLFVKESDVDLVITVPYTQLQEGRVAFLVKIYNQLLAGQRTWGLGNVSINTYAAIPLVNAIDLQTGLEVGIICAPPGSRTSGLQNSQWIRTAVEEYPSVIPLVIILKKLLRHNNRHQVNSGGISSYALTLMVISYMQHANRQCNLGDLLLGFLKLYGDDFDYENQAIVLTDGGEIVEKHQLRGMTAAPHHKLIIQDPVDYSKNAAKQQAGNSNRVQKVFKEAYDALDERVNDNMSGEGFDSFLEVIFDIRDLNLDG